MSNPTAGTRQESSALPAAGRVIRPADGVLLEQCHFSLEDVGALAQALIDRSEERLEKLRAASAEIEERLRRHAADERRRIEQVIEAARQRAREEMRDVVEQAGRLRDEARTKGQAEGLARGREEGHAEGFEVGLAEGRAKGERETRAALREMLEAEVATAREIILRVSSALDQGWKRLVHDARADLLALAIGAAEKLIRREVRDVPDIVRGSLNAAIDRVADRRRMSIEIHPADLEVVSSWLDDLKRRLEETSGIRIVEREDICRGGCVIRSGAATIDLTIETQLEILARRLAEEESVPA